MSTERFLEIACFECWTYWAEMFGPAAKRGRFICQVRHNVIRKAWALSRMYGYTHLGYQDFADATGLNIGTIWAALTRKHPITDREVAA